MICCLTPCQKGQAELHKSVHFIQKKRVNHKAAAVVAKVTILLPTISEWIEEGAKTDETMDPILTNSNNKFIKIIINKIRQLLQNIINLQENLYLIYVIVFYFYKRIHFQNKLIFKLTRLGKKLSLIFCNYYKFLKIVVFF